MVELYDRGNIILTDQQFCILNLLRQRTDKNTDERFAVRETYPAESAKSLTPPFQSEAELVEKVAAQFALAIPGGKKKKQKQTIVKVLNSLLGYGTDILEHFLIQHELDGNASSLVDEDGPELKEARVRNKYFAGVICCAPPYIATLNFNSWTMK